MTRKNKLILLIAYMLILALVMLVYFIDRSAKSRNLRAELARINTEQNRTSNVETEVKRLTRLIPTETSSPAFIELLYRHALESGLKQHEVTTGPAATSNQSAARPGASQAVSVEKHHIKVSAAGSYRGFAEYLRRVQNSERFNRITEFKLLPDAELLKGTITIELYSLPVKNAK